MARGKQNRTVSINFGQDLSFYGHVSESIAWVGLIDNDLF